MTIFINGKQKRVPRPPLIEGLPVEEFIARNADPIGLHENGLWELMTPDTPDDELECGPIASGERHGRLRSRPPPVTTPAFPQGGSKWTIRPSSSGC